MSSIEMVAAVWRETVAKIDPKCMHRFVRLVSENCAVASVTTFLFCPQKDLIARIPGEPSSSPLPFL
jgi:hypothetical protein